MSGDAGDLTERMHAGDEKAREELVVSNLPLVSYIVNRTCRQGIREDAAQEAAIRLWLSAPRHNPRKTKFSTYAFTCIKNKVLDVAKGDARYSAKIHPIFDGFDRIVEKTPLDDLVHSEEKKFIEKLHEAVQELPLYERFVVTFHYGLYGENPRPISEISKMLKVTNTRAKSLEKRAYRILRKALKYEN